MYKTIVNPETGRKVNVNGKIGQRVLTQYANQLGGGLSWPARQGFLKDCRDLKSKPGSRVDARPEKIYRRRLPAPKECCPSHDVRTSKCQPGADQSCLPQAVARNLLEETPEPSGEVWSGSMTCAQAEKQQCSKLQEAVNSSNRGDDLNLSKYPLMKYALDYGREHQCYLTEEEADRANDAAQQLAQLSGMLAAVDNKGAPHFNMGQKQQIAGVFNSVKHDPVKREQLLKWVSDRLNPSPQ